LLLTDPTAQAWRLAILAHAVALTGSITDPMRQGQALTTVVEALAATDDPDRAEALARSITDPAWQARALTTPATHVEPALARPLVAWALRMDGWLARLRALARIQPAVVIAIADEFLEDSHGPERAGGHPAAEVAL
jgi:hypothetical protein